MTESKDEEGREERIKGESNEDESLIRDSMRSVLEKHKASATTQSRRPLVDDPTVIEAAKVLLRLVQGRGKPKNMELGDRL